MDSMALQNVSLIFLRFFFLSNFTSHESPLPHISIRNAFGCKEQNIQCMLAYTNRGLFFSHDKKLIGMLFWSGARTKRWTQDPSISPFHHCFWPFGYYLMTSRCTSRHLTHIPSRRKKRQQRAKVKGKYMLIESALFLCIKWILSQNPSPAIFCLWLIDQKGTTWWNMTRGAGLVDGGNPANQQYLCHPHPRSNQAAHSPYSTSAFTSFPLPCMIFTLPHLCLLKGFHFV